MKTMKEMFGGDVTKPLILGSEAAATCKKCGMKPVLKTQRLESGREMAIWFLPDHHRYCGDKSKGSEPE
jgi:hypothetical protein